jgi:phosphoglycerol transferase MdoB-like AlkP superfamily enzyme
MDKRFILKGNIYGILLVRLAILLIALSFSRLFLYFLNLHLFTELSHREFLKIVFTGLRFDLSTLCIIASPFIFFNTLPFRFRTLTVYQTVNDVFLYTLFIIAMSGNFIDVIYFRFTGKRMTGDIFRYLGAGDDYRSLIPHFLHDFWQPLVLWVALSLLAVFLASRFRVRAEPPPRSRFIYLVSNTFLFLIFAFFTVIGIRGGFQLRPISIITSGKYTEAQYTSLVLNTPFTVVKSSTQLKLQHAGYFSDESSLDKVYTPFHSATWHPDTIAATEEHHGYNVVVIILESFSSEYIGAFNKGLDNGHYQGYTPFLDSIIGVSMSYNGFANGKKSIEAIPAILAGIPVLMNDSYITSSYAGNRINSLASLLKEQGYASSFFHGGTNGTMGFESFTQMAGFDRYIGRDEYNNDKDYDGSWGIYDEPFFQYYAQCLDTTRQPFVSAIFSLSSHHPFVLPPPYKNKFRKGPLEIQECVGYSDYSLRRFFQTASTMRWYDHTLFVITADHTSMTYFPQYETPVGLYRVPVIFYLPGRHLKQEGDMVVQQSDIMPTVLDFLHFDEAYIAFGSSVFDTTAHRYSLTFLNNIYQLVEGDYAYQWNGHTPLGLYDYKTDVLMKTNLLKQKTEVAKDMETFMKAVIQQYNNRMIENRLTVIK